MAEAYVLATELDRHGDYSAAFAAYERKLKPVTLKKQRDAVRISKFFVPSKRSFTRLRRLVDRLLFSSALIRYAFKFFDVESILTRYQ